MSNSGTRGIWLQPTGSAYLKANVNGNVMTANPTVGFQASPFGSSTLCLKLTNNTSSNGFQLTQTAGTTFNEEPESGNTGTVTKTGTINSVSAGACACQ